jgi:O-antigen ligase
MLIMAQFSPYVAAMMGKGETASSTEYRRLLFQRGMEEIRKHPALGTTLKSALQNLDDISQGQHIVDLVNGYINYGLTAGYWGIIGLLAVFLLPCGAMLMARRRFWQSELARNAAASVFAISGFMIFVSFFTSFGNEISTPFYEILGMGSALWALRRTVLVGADANGGEPLVAAPTGIRAIIARDREAARLRAMAQRSEPLRQ